LFASFIAATLVTTISAAPFMASTDQSISGLISRPHGPSFGVRRVLALALAALPGGAISIDRFAFRDCTGLRLKGTPRGMKSLEEGALESCNH
jgi:hypothetical protein